jgi:hypothetical protein
MQQYFTPTDADYAPPKRSELRYAPDADPTRTKPTAAQRNRDMANLREEMLEASRANGSLVAAHLLGVLA